MSAKAPGGFRDVVDLGAQESHVAITSSISLTDDRYAFARALVETGRSQSSSAVLQQGVDPLRQTTDAEKMGTEALCKLLSGRRAGEFVDAGKRTVVGSNGREQEPRASHSFLGSRHWRKNRLFA